MALVSLARRLPAPAPPTSGTRARSPLVLSSAVSVPPLPARHRHAAPKGRQVCSSESVRLAGLWYTRSFVSTHFRSARLSGEVGFVRINASFLSAVTPHLKPEPLCSGEPDQSQRLQDRSSVDGKRPTSFRFN